MTKKINLSDLKTFDLAEELKTSEDILHYLNAVMEEDDPSELTHALGVIARARGMTQIAKDSGIARESLYHALSSGTQPRFETVSKVCRALGLKLTVAPV